MLSYHDDWHPKTRMERFPLVEERVKRYMMKWYYHCPSEIASLLQYRIPSAKDRRLKGRNQTSLIHVRRSSLGDEYSFEYGIRHGDFPLYLDQALLIDCGRGLLSIMFDKIRIFKSPTGYTIHNRLECRNSCEDLIQLTSDITEVPVLATLGNATMLYKDKNAEFMSTIPIFAPWRQIIAHIPMIKTSHQDCSAHNDSLRAAAIIWPMNSMQQHTYVRRASEFDISWHKKRPIAVWRCLFSSSSCSYAHLQTKEACLERDEICRFVYDHAKSKLVDAGYGRKFPLTVEELDGISMYKHQFGLPSLQTYKILLHFEGNSKDYGASLAWKLYSKSVVLMPPPTKSTWLMEELLEPWVHYIPLNNTKSSAEKMVQWVIDNDEMAQRIAERASLYIYDLMMHPDAIADDENVKRQIIRRYKSHWIASSLF